MTIAETERLATTLSGLDEQIEELIWEARYENLRQRKRYGRERNRHRRREQNRHVLRLKHGQGGYHRRLLHPRVFLHPSEVAAGFSRSLKHIKKRNLEKKNYEDGCGSAKRVRDSETVQHLPRRRTSRMRAECVRIRGTAAGRYPLHAAAASAAAEAATTTSLSSDIPRGAGTTESGSVFLDDLLTVSGSMYQELSELEEREKALHLQGRQADTEHRRESAKENERTLELGNQKLNEVQDKLAEKERRFTEARVVIQKLKDEIHEAKMSALRESSDVRSIAEEEVESLKTELASKTDALKERVLDVVHLESDLKAARRKSKQTPQEESGGELQQKLQEAVRKLKDRERSQADMEEEFEEKDDKISELKKESTLAKTAMSMYEKRVDVLKENLKTACKRYDEEVKSRRIVEAAAKKADEHAQSMAEKNVELQRELLRRQPEESLYEMEVSIGEKKELRRAQSDLEEERKTVMRLKSAIEDLKKDQTRHSEADHSDRTNILRTEIADLKEKLAEATRKESSLIKDVEKLTALKDENEKESRRMEKQLSDKDRTAIDLRNEIDTLEEKMKQNGSDIDDQMTAYKEEIERNVKRMKELDATIAKKIQEAAGLEDEIAVLKEGKECDGRKIKGLGVQLANKGREATALKDEIAALQTDLSRAHEECADDRSAELSILLEKTKDELVTDFPRSGGRQGSRDQVASREEVVASDGQRRSADLDKLRDLLKTIERERVNLESQLSNVDKNVTDSKETDSLKRELERHRQEIRQLERLLNDEKREKSGESNDRMISELSKELKTVIDARDRLVKENTEMEKRLSESEKSLSNLYDESMKKVVHLEES
ncbi:myosin-10-like, partial [Anneissia japonica]|uniref:myosin-10-like n=1 Tax=Anneissia japonica TaxID=1529436 RepID=UPI0014255BF0